MHIPLSRPDLNENDRAAVLEVLESSVLSLGPKLPEFEHVAAQIAGTRFGAAVNSGTSGLHLCVKAAGIGEGDEVITTPFSFVASSNCILFERATPVFVDIDPVTYNLEPDLVERAITPRTKALLPVHVFGRPCNMAALNRIAREYDLVVIEDACEAIGARFHGRPAGSLGHMGVFAFYPNKQITTGEGGVIVTDDEEIARKCRSARNQGRSDNGAWMEHDILGYNYRLSDLNCALGISQLSRVGEVLAARRRVAHAYSDALQNIPEVIPPPLYEAGAEISWFVYVVRLRDEFTREDRDEIILDLSERGVSSRNYFPAIHLQKLYRERFGYRPGSFPITEHTADRTIALPFFNQLSDDQVEYVCEALRQAIRTLRRKARARAITMTAV